MKRFILLILMACLASPVIHASDDSRASDREALKKILIQIQNALNTMDMDALMQAMDDEVTISFMTTEVAVGKKQIESYYNKMFADEGAPLTSHTTIATVDAPAIFHGNTAIAHGKANDTFVLKNGDTHKFDTRWTATVIKNPEDWKVVSISFSVNPFNNIILEEIKKHLRLYTILAFFAGIIATVILIKIRKTTK